MRNWKTIPMEFEDRRTIAPFAGNHPTRWKIRMVYSMQPGARRLELANRGFSYFGKPDVLVGSRVLQLMQTCSTGRIRAWEFDRAGLLASVDLNLPRTSLPVHDWAPPKFQFYYPWLWSSAVMFGGWNHWMHRIPIVFRKKRYITYAVNIPELISAQDWGAHKAWLENADIQLGR